MYSVEPFRVLLAVITLSALVETLSFLLVYRSGGFRRLKNEITVLRDKMDTLKAAGRKEDDKVVKRTQHELNKALPLLFKYRAAVMVLQLVLIGGAWRLLASKFKGRALVKLPFEPFSIVRRLTHSGLPGEDWSEAGFHFVYVFASAAVRGTCMKLVNRSSTSVMASLGQSIGMLEFKPDGKVA